MLIASLVLRLLLAIRGLQAFELNSRQSSCTDPDVSNAKDAYNNANGGQLILDNLVRINSANILVVARFPDLVVQGITDPPSNLDCTDLDNPSSCVAPRGSDGQICSALIQDDNTAAGVVVIESYLKMYNFLRNSLNAAQRAHDTLAQGNFLSTMREDLQPGTDIFGKIALKVLDIAIGFIPVGGIEIAAIKAAVKVFKKISKETIKSTIKNDKQTEPPSIEDLRTQLDALLVSFQNAIRAQHKQIFIDDNEQEGEGVDNPQFTWLADGTQLALTMSEDDLTSNMRDSMSHFMLSSYISALKGHVVRASELDGERLGINCGKLPTMQSSDGGGCDCFGYPKKDIFNGFLEGVQPKHSDSLTENSGLYGGISFPKIIDNALACEKNGGDIGDVDLTDFLNDPSSTVPDCLFGIPVISIDDNGKVDRS